jgi:hypothetical protein
MSKKAPRWVLKIRKEIKRLDNKIHRLEKKRDVGKVDEIDALEDLSNWRGWQVALRWALKMRDGKTTRKAAWGRRS